MTVQETTLRNTPSLLDLDRAPRLGLDGRYASLDDLLRDKLVSQHLGWKEADRARAVANLQNVLMNDARTDYRALFQAAYRVDVEALDRGAGARAGGPCLDRLRARDPLERTSRWDAFADINRIPAAPSAGELPKHYGGRTHGRIGNQEGRLEIKRPLGFRHGPTKGSRLSSASKAPRRSETASSATCRPRFTDNRFHNAGMSQLEYEALHGKGSFAKLAIPGFDAKRPVASFLAIPAKDDPKRVDLGYWNWIDLKAAPERVGEESDADLLRRMAGAFRTPNLRNLPRTGPYMHNGAYATLEDAVRAKIEVSKRGAGQGPARGRSRIPGDAAERGRRQTAGCLPPQPRRGRRARVQEPAAPLRAGLGRSLVGTGRLLDHHELAEREVSCGPILRREPDAPHVADIDREGRL